MMLSLWRNQERVCREERGGKEDDGCLRVMNEKEGHKGEFYERRKLLEGH